jgi:hypothetical protein
MYMHVHNGSKKYANISSACLESHLQQYICSLVLVASLPNTTTARNCVTVFNSLQWLLNNSDCKPWASQMYIIHVWTFLFVWYYSITKSSDSAVGLVVTLQARQLRNCGLIPGGGRRFFLSTRKSRRILRPMKLPIQCVPGALPLRQSSRGIKLTTHLHLVLRLRISGAVALCPPPPPHACMACIGITLPTLPILVVKWHEGSEVGYRYSSTLSLTLVLGGGWSTQRPFISEKKSWHPLYRRLSEPQGWSGWVWKIPPPARFNPQTVQPVASHYTNYAILALFYSTLFSIWYMKTVVDKCYIFFQQLQCTAWSNSEIKKIIVHFTCNTHIAAYCLS